MKGFLLAMLLGVGLATVGAVAAVRVLFPEAVAETPAAGGLSQDQQEFTKAEALEVVGARLGDSGRARELRRLLSERARVDYHSPQHWTVRLEDASWTAHGAGRRYAEPDNDAARRLEAEAGGGS